MFIVLVLPTTTLKTPLKEQDKSVQLKLIRNVCVVDDALKASQLILSKCIDEKGLYNPVFI